MKKILIIAALFLALISPLNVKAGIKNTIICDKPTIDADNNLIKVCYLNIEVTNNTRFYKINGELKFTNSSLKSIEVIDTRFTMTNNNNNITFISKNAVKNETIKLAKITLYIPTNGDDCLVTWQPTEYGINYSCNNIDGNYYDNEGTFTDFITYDKKCNHYCEIIDNKYYGKAGNIVDEKTYDKECNKHTCEIIDNIYYDNNSNIVSEKEYNKSCGKYSCVIVDNEYYNSKGNVVSEKEYNKDCGKYSCVIVDNEYYDETGKSVDKATWEEICTIPENPTTGSGSVIAAALLGLISLIFIIITTKKSTKIYKI